MLTEASIRGGPVLYADTFGRNLCPWRSQDTWWPMRSQDRKTADALQQLSEAICSLILFWKYLVHTIVHWIWKQKLCVGLISARHLLPGAGSVTLVRCVVLTPSDTVFSAAGASGGRTLPCPLLTPTQWGELSWSTRGSILICALETTVSTLWGSMIWWSA